MKVPEREVVRLQTLKTREIIDVCAVLGAVSLSDEYHCVTTDAAITISEPDKETLQKAAAAIAAWTVEKRKVSADYVGDRLKRILIGDSSPCREALEFAESLMMRYTKPLEDGNEA